MQLREALAEECLDMLIKWLKDGGNVGIHGALEPLWPALEAYPPHRS